MAVTDPDDTLAFHLSRPLSATRDMRGIPVKHVAQKIAEFMKYDDAPETVPEAEALWFYAMNHGMAEVRKAKALYEPLGALLPFVEDYYRELSPKAVRAFYYLMLICTREARHMHKGTGLEQKMKQQFGAAAWEWTQGAISETEIQKKLLNNPPAMTIGDYVGALRMVFYEGNFSSSYGGPAWGAVTDCLHRFVLGEFSAEMMLDNVWTLAHNNGPIFNKGHIYKCYTSHIYKVLDVQASGQMHEFILTDKVGQVFAPLKLVAHSNWVKSTFPEAVGEYVDWYMVEALGSKHKYVDEKIAQVEAHGMPATASAADKIAAKNIAAKQAAEAAAIAKEKAAWFEIMPGHKIAKLTRQQLAA